MGLARVAASQVGMVPVVKRACLADVPSRLAVGKRWPAASVSVKKELRESECRRMAESRVWRLH